MISGQSTRNSTLNPEPSTTIETTSNIYPISTKILNGRFFIKFQLDIQFNCSSNTTTTTNIQCPNLQEIEKKLNQYFNDLKFQLTLNENITSNVILQNNNDGTITINCTLRTDNKQDFHSLDEYIKSEEFEQDIAG